MTPKAHRHVECAQEDSIEAISKTLDRMEKSQETIVDLLKIVSNQTPRIENLEVHSERAYGEMNLLTTRMRDLELTVSASGPTVRQQFHDTIDLMNKKLDKLNRFFVLTTSKPALMTYSIVFGSFFVLVLAGSALDVMYHFETLKLWYHIWRG